MRKRSVMLGMPELRPKCIGCGKPLEPVAIEDEVREAGTNPDGSSFIRHRRLGTKTFQQWYAYGPGFHSLRCALSFATKAYNAGFRVSHG